jgi:hypothetical protein
LTPLSSLSIKRKSGVKPPHSKWAARTPVSKGQRQTEVCRTDYELSTVWANKLAG